MNFQYIIFSALLAVTVADLGSHNFSHIQSIEDFPHLQKEYPDVKYVVSFGGSSSRIVGGEEAKPGQFPYQVRQLAFPTDGGVHLCGASVISNEYVLTAAHCFGKKKIKQVDLFYGAHNVNQVEPEQVRVKVPGANIIYHPEHNILTHLNDIALIKLNAPIAFTARIQPVALPSRSQASDLFEGESAIVSGWGVFSSGSDQSNVLRFVQLPIIANAQCKKSFWTVTASNICGDGANGHSFCSGDSGGPYVMNKNGKNIQVGIVSFGNIPCDAGYPAAFVRVTSYLDFIAQNSNIVIEP